MECGHKLGTRPQNLEIFKISGKTRDAVKFLGRRSHLFKNVLIYKLLGHFYDHLIAKIHIFKIHLNY